MRSYDGGQEARPGTPPYLFRQAPVEQREFGPGDRMVEGDDRFAQAVHAAVLTEGVHFTPYESTVLKDRQGMRDVTGGPLQTAGDPPRGGVAGCECREYGVVESPVPEIGLVREEIAGLAVERGAR